MSTKKEIEKQTSTVAEDDNNVKYNARSAYAYTDTFASDNYQRPVDKALDETKDNIKRGIEEARREIPRNIQAINDYQEQSLQAAKEITESYLDSQKQIINSFQSMWAPYLESTYNTFWNWASPQRSAELYARGVSTFADNMLSTIRLTNNTMITNMETFSTTIQRRKNDTKEFAKIGINTARTFEQTSRNAAQGTDKVARVS
jgi:hypothetical protein